MVILDFRKEPSKETSNIVCVKVLSKAFTCSYIDTSYVVRNDTLTIRDILNRMEIHFGDQFSILPTELVCIDGSHFFLQVSNSYSPLEIANLKAAYEANVIKLHNEQVVRQQQEKSLKEEREKQELLEQQEWKRKEAERIEVAKEAERVEQMRVLKEKYDALSSYPHYTNKVATITDTLNGIGYTNVLLRFATLKGIVYAETDKVGGGMILYTNLDSSALIDLGFKEKYIGIYMAVCTKEMEKETELKLRGIASRPSFDYEEYQNHIVEANQQVLQRIERLRHQNVGARAAYGLRE
jgi:hypothetical protein